LFFREDRMEMDLNRPTSLILRTCKQDGTSYNGFRWPEEGFVKPDGFDGDQHGRGLYGWLHGEGERSYGYGDEPGARWLVVETYGDVICDCGSKAVYPYGWVVHCCYNEQECMGIIRSGRGLQYRLREQRAAEEQAIADEKRRQKEEEQRREEEEEQRREEARRYKALLAQQEEELRQLAQRQEEQRRSALREAEINLAQEAVAERPVEAPREAQKPLYVSESIPLPSARPEPRYEAPAQPRKQRAPEPRYEGMTEGDRIFLAACSVVLGWTLKLLWTMVKLTVRATGKVLLLALRKLVALAKPPAPRVVIIKQQDEAFLQILGQVRELGVTQVKQIAVGDEQPAYWVFKREEQEVV
jgi:hypothetical protein